MKVLLSLFLVLIAVFGLYVQVDENALKIYEETFNRAVYSFALVKGLNALISVIQSTEINVSLFVGATVGIGQVLDPINDLVERFSVVMLLSSISIGVQHLILVLGKSLFIKILLTISILVTIIGIWVKKIHSSKVFVFSIKLTMFLLILRFGAVVFLYTTQLVYQDVYSEQYNNSNSYIKMYKDDLEVIQDNKEDMDSLLDQLKNKTETFSKKVIELMTIFVVTTILFPLIYLWLLIVLIKFIFNLKFNDDMMQNILQNRKLHVQQ